MSSRRLRHAVSVAVSALLALMVLGPGVTSAATPGWTMNVTTLPSTVSPGAAAGYRVVITNAGKSNIAKLALTDSRTEAPVSVTTSAGSCNSAGQLLCNLGALRSGASVTVTVAYLTSGASPFSITFEANTSGVSFSDGGTSHGDALRQTATTTLNSNPNFKGGFTLDTSAIATDQSLSGTNIQSTKIIPPTTGIGVSISDGPANTGTACSQVPQTPIGEWSSLDVAQGTTFGAPFPVTLHILTSSLPHGFTLASVKACHDLGGGVTETITAHCPTGTPTAQCVSANLNHGTLAHCFYDEDSDHDADDYHCIPASGYLEIVVWLLRNGGIRGGY